MINANKVMGNSIKGLTKPYPYLSSGCKTNKSLLFIVNKQHISKEIYPMSIQFLESWFEWVKYFGNKSDKEYSEIVKKHL